MSASLIALVLPLCSAYARAQHAATGHDLRRAVAIRDGDYQARTGPIDWTAPVEGWRLW